MKRIKFFTMLVVVAALIFSCLCVSGYAQEALPTNTEETVTPAPQAEPLNAEEPKVDPPTESTPIPATEITPEPITEDTPAPMSEATPTPATETEPPQPKIIRVAFVVDENSTAIELAEGNAIEKPKNVPAKEGFSFLYWYDTADASKSEFRFGVPAAKDLTLAALFEQIVATEQIPADATPTPADVPAADATEEPSTAPETYVVQFLNADDSEFYRAECAKNSPIPQPDTVPSMDGFTFEYWFDTAAGDATPFTFGSETVLEKNIVFKAFFTAIAENPEVEAKSDLSQAVVRIWMDATPETQIGETVSIFCAIDNFYGWDHTLQWQRKDENGEWSDVSGANGMSHSFVLTENTLETDWRMKVDIVTADGD